VARPEWTLSALLDIDAIAVFINRQSPSYARTFAKRLSDAAEALEAFPRRGRLVPELERKGIRDVRELLFQNYRIVYSVKGSGIVVLGVWHEAVDIRRRLRERLWDIT
jgi:toxin ParE1/3/4